jgi:hypothetical protein
MTKKFFALILVLILALPLCAQAASTGFQDIASYTNGAVRYEYKTDKDTYLQKVYKALNGDGESYAKMYVDLLDGFSMFDYIGTYDTGGWVHLCLSAGYNYNFDTFRLVSYGKVLAPYSVVMVSYHPDRNDIYVRYSHDLMLTDLGYRSSNVPAAKPQSGNGKVQDPVSFSNGAVRDGYDVSGDENKHKAYKVLDGNAQLFANAYCNMLDGLDNLTFLGVYDTGGWVHHCFGAQSGYNYDTFRLVSYGKELTPYSVVIVSWKPGSNELYVRYSNEIMLTDLGYRY